MEKKGGGNTVPSFRGEREKDRHHIRGISPLRRREGEVKECRLRKKRGIFALLYKGDGILILH